MFYDKVLTIKSSVEGVLNEDGIWYKGQDFLLKVIQCDAQPYSSQLLYKDYGYTEDVKYRVFCDKDNDITVGLPVEYEGKTYKIVRIISWDDHMELMIDD